MEGKGGHAQFDGLTVLGCPVGERSYAEKWAVKWAARLKEEYEALQSLEHPQLELWLMRAVMPYKVMNVLRNCPMDLSETIAEQHDALLDQAFARALGRSGGSSLSRHGRYAGCRGAWAVWDCQQRRRWRWRHTWEVSGWPVISRRRWRRQRGDRWRRKWGRE